jgi:hypothetical protein
MALVRTVVSDERIASIIRAKRISKLRTTLVVPFHPDDVCDSTSETSVVARATRRHIPEGSILNSERRENLKSHIALTGLALWRRSNVFPVRYELDSYIPEDGTIDSLRCKNPKSYRVSFCLPLVGWWLSLPAESTPSTSHVSLFSSFSLNGMALALIGVPSPTALLNEHATGGSTKSSLLVSDALIDVGQTSCHPSAELCRMVVGWCRGAASTPALLYGSS